MNTAILISGGLDSTILTVHLLKTCRSVLPIYVRCGHVWEEAELAFLKRFLKRNRNSRLKPLQILSLETRDLYENHWSLTGRNVPGAESNDKQVYLPGKNLLLIAKTAVFCAINRIPRLALAPLETNPFPDANVSFFKALEKACSQGLKFKLRIQTPFLRSTKKEVMKLGRNLPLELTFSCLNPKRRGNGYLHCGTCNKCAERKKAFRQAGLQDRTLYAH